jgi:hypothetical protein
VVSRVSRLDVMALLNEPIEVDLVPDFEKGEVLLDSRVLAVFSVERFARKKHIFYLQNSVPQFCADCQEGLR